MIVDFDLHYGTAGLDFDQDPPQGVVEAVSAPDRLDTTLMERMLSKLARQSESPRRARHARRALDFESMNFDHLIDMLRASVPCIMLDLPHNWIAPVKRCLVAADEIMLVAEPDLANLRNAKSLYEW